MPGRPFPCAAISPKEKMSRARCSNCAAACAARRSRSIWATNRTAFRRRRATRESSAACAVARSRTAFKASCTPAMPTTTPLARVARSLDATRPLGAPIRNSAGDRLLRPDRSSSGSARYPRQRATVWIRLWTSRQRSMTIASPYHWRVGMGRKPIARGVHRIVGIVQGCVLMIHELRAWRHDLHARELAALPELPKRASRVSRPAGHPPRELQQHG